MIGNRTIILELTIQIVIAILLIILPMIHTVSQMKNMNLIEAIRSENI